MEITYSRTCHYSVDLSAADHREPARHLGLTTRQPTKAVEEETLLEDHWDGVMDWLNNRTVEPDPNDRDDIDDIEVHA